MPLRERNSPEGANGNENWLGSDEPGRSRPWAYEELLFGSTLDRGQARELGAVVGELETERLELARLHEELDTHLVRIARLDRRLKELTTGVEHDEPRPSPTPLPHTRGAPADEEDVRASLDQRSYSLARCEGFEVDSPLGPVGVVEGLRFISRIDRPDLLEVRGGRFGRQLLLVPIEQVEDVRPGERCVVLRSAPTLTSDLLDDLVDRVRRALHFEHTAS
jgi:hypothetical protein